MLENNNGNGYFVRPKIVGGFDVVMLINGGLSTTLATCGYEGDAKLIARLLNKNENNFTVRDVMLPTEKY